MAEGKEVGAQSRTELLGPHLYSSSLLPLTNLLLIHPPPLPMSWRDQAVTCRHDLPGGASPKSWAEDPHLWPLFLLIPAVALQPFTLLSPSLCLSGPMHTSCSSSWSHAVPGPLSPPRRAPGRWHPRSWEKRQSLRAWMGRE